MLSRFPAELNQATFPRAWNYVSKKFRYSKKCHVTAHIVERAGHLLFFAMMLVMVCGMLYSYLPFPGLSEFFQKAPWFTQRWTNLYVNYLLPVIISAGLPRDYGDLIVCLAAIWVIPFLVCTLLTGLVHLVYWPRSVAMPEEEAAQALLNTARAVNRNSGRTKINTASGTSMLFLLTMGVILTLFIVEIIQNKPAALSDMPAKQKYITYGCVFAALFCYSVVNYPLALLLKLLHWCHIPKTHMAAMEAYLKSALPQQEECQEVTVQDFPATDPDSLPKGFFNRDVLFARLTGFPCPITAETFPKAWRWAARKLQWAQKRVPVAQVTNWVAHPIYLLVLLVLSFGALYQQSIPLVNTFLEKAPKLVTLWNKIRLFLYPAAATTWQKGLAWATFLYLVPLGLSILAALAVFLIYYPKIRKRDASDAPTEQSRQLCLLLREAKAKSKPPKGTVLGSCNIIFGAVWLFAAFGLLLFAFGNPETKDIVFDKAHLANLGLFLAFLVMAIGYRILALPLTLCLKLLTFTWVPKKALQISEDWFTRCEDAAEATHVAEEPDKAAGVEEDTPVPVEE